MNNKVAIILVNWNSFDVTNDCILSLEQCTYSEYSIIVVDNDSHDDSGNRLKNSHPGIVLLRSETNIGFTGGNNIGLQYSLENGFGFSLMLNNDTFVQPDFLTPLISYLNKYPKAGAIQPKIFFHHNRNLVWNAGGYFNRLVGFTYTTGHNKPFHSKYDLLKQVDWITGCAFLVRNDVLRQTGLLANNMFMYSEDVDLSMRIRNQDYILVYEPASVIYHIAGIAGKSKTKGKEGYTNPMVHYLNQRNRIWILKKYIPWYFLPTTVLFNFFYILLVMGYFAMRGRFHKLKTVARAVKSGLSESIKYH